MSLLPKLNGSRSIDTVWSWIEALIAYFELSSDAPQSAAVPVGTMVGWYGTVPSGWYACVGTALLRAEYPVLFAQLGTAFGTGSGATQFQLPNQSLTMGGVACKWIIKHD